MREEIYNAALASTYMAFERLLRLRVPGMGLDRHRLYLFEDNCESMGASLSGKPCGTFGEINTFSTFFSHHISTMEGGVIATSDTELYHLARSLRAHGWTLDVARKPAVVTELQAVDERLQNLSGRFLTGGTPAVAAAELQKLAKDLAAQASTEIRSERILPPVERGELLEIPIEIAVSGEIRQLVDLLSRLEQTAKLLTVQDFKVRVVNIAQPRDLLATLILSGFILDGKARS